MQPQNSDLTFEQKINLAIERGLKPLYTPEPLRLSAWADEHFYLSAESSGVQGAWQTLPYQKAIMNAISNDDIRILTWMKSARTGYSKIIVAAVGYFAEHKKRNQVIFQPTDSDAEDFVKDEIDTMLRDVPVVGQLLRSDPEKKSKDNTRTKKTFNGSILDIKGGKSARNFRRMTKDVAYYDELEGFDANIDNEGSATALGDARLTTSSFPKSIRGSTPGVKETSQIQSSLDEADEVFLRYVPCPDCGDYHVLKWSNMKWVDNDPSTAKMACEECGSLFGYKHYSDMDDRGEWRSENMWIDEDDVFHFHNGQICEPPKHIGFKIWAGYSYYMTWGDLVSEFLKANQAKKKGDLTKLQSFVNIRLGEGWEEDQGDQLDWVALKSRAEPYAVLEVPMKGLMLCCGVDTQDNRLAVTIIAYGRNEESWVIYFGELYGDPAQNEVWNQLTELLDRPYKHASGNNLYISSTAIDTGGHRTQAVYNYCRGKINVIAVKGASVSGKPILGRPSYQDITWGGKTIKGGVKLWSVGSDTAKSFIYGKLGIKDPGTGFIHFPIGLDDEYYQQLTAEALVTRYKNGFPSQIWVKKRDRNEALDVTCYCYAAFIRAGGLTKNWDYIEGELISSEIERKTPELPSRFRPKVRNSNNPLL